jgi:fido (protein-threonine AMPylation protein)
MSRYSDSDPYLDPATGVLINRLGITDESTLEQVEADMVAARSSELSRTPRKGAFDLAHLRAIHKHLFGDLYDWAGELRTIDIAREETISLVTRELKAPPRRSSSSSQTKNTWPASGAKLSATAPRITSAS